MKTKIEMTKEIFFEATNGKRTLDNYAKGMMVIETIAASNYKAIIGEYYEKLCNGEISAIQALRTIGGFTYDNILWSNGMKAKQFYRDFSIFTR